MYADLNVILSKYNATSLVQARPDGKTQAVRDLYEVKLSDNSKINQLFEEMNSLTLIDDLLKVCDVKSTEDVPTVSCESSPFNDPLVQGSNSWYLNGMNIPCAWTLAKGDGQVVAVIDEYFDNSHSDMQNKFHSIKYFTTNSNPTCSHGFATSGAVAAIVNNGICTVGSGYNAKVAGYIIGSNQCGYIDGSARRQAILAAANDGHKIISISSAYAPLSRAETEELIADGVVILHSAYGEPLNPLAMIDGYIYVGQADINRNHVYYEGEYPGADIYALSINVARLQAQNGCSYGTGNTSFGTPTIAGVVALMRSVNPCLTPSDIETILKATVSGPIGNNPDGRPAGIMDAYQAVLDAQNGIDYVVSSNATVDQIKKVSGKVVIESGITLTVTGTLQVGKRIIVKKGGHLNINGGLVTELCGQWEGVIVEGNGSNQSGAGKVTMSNGAIIEKAVDGISMNPYYLGWPAVSSAWGGLVDASNSTIRDCRRAVAFMQMENDASKFTTCTFSNIVNSAVTLWDNNNVNFTGCTFKTIGKSAILAYDSRVDVYRNTFNTATNGVEVVSTMPLPFASYLSTNTFTGLTNGIYAMAQANGNDLRISSNNFYGGAHAITLEGISSYEVSLNTVVGSGFGVRFWGTSNNLQNDVMGNFISSSDWGSLANYQNRAEYTDNCFGYNGKDIEVNTGSIYDYHGDQEVGASNCFSRGGTPDITAFNNTSFKYFYLPSKPTNCRTPLNNGNYVKATSTSEHVIDCSSLIPIILRKCLKPSSQNQANIMIAQLEAAIASLLADNNMDPTLKAYLLQRYRDCLQKIKKTKVVIIVKDTREIVGKEQAAKDAASFARSTDDLSTQILGFGVLADAGLYTEANAYLNNFPSTSPEANLFVSIEKINLKYLVNRGNFVLTAADKIALEGFGNNTTPISGYARSLYYKLTGEKMPITFIYDGKVTPRLSTTVSIPNTVSVFPNPVQDNILNVQIDGGESLGAYGIEVYDMQGHMVYRNAFNHNGILPVDISMLASGIFIVKVNFENRNIHVGKFVKM